VIDFNIQENMQNEFAFRLGRVRDLVQRGLVDPELGTLRVQARLLTERCMALTPPKNQAQGKARVKFDINRIFHPVNPEDLNSPALRSLVRRSDQAAWNSASSHIGKGPLSGTTAVTPTEELHRLNRDRRGRAKRTSYVTLWKQRGALNRLMKSVQARVGWAKAGWLNAYRALGGQRAPAWVTRHPNSPGRIIEGLSNPLPFVEVTNETKWAGRAGSQAIVRQALAMRARDMKTYFEKMMGLAASGTATPYQAQQAQIAAQFTDAA